MGDDKWLCLFELKIICHLVRKTKHEKSGEARTHEARKSNIQKTHNTPTKNNYFRTSNLHNMILHPIDTGNFKLDGGAMFGVVPKSIWSRTNPPDANNMCSWSMRCLLIEDGEKLILVDTGIGDKQSEKFFSYYYMFGCWIFNG